MRLQKVIALTLVSTLLPSIAMAQNYDPGTGPENPVKKDERPKPPRPVVVADGKAAVKDQAGTGGTIAYAEAGVIELGGSAGFNVSSNLTTVTFKPQIGWFFADNFQISGLIDVTYSNPEGTDGTTFVSVLAEPSYHLPFTDAIFGFAGVGIGVQHAGETGFAVVPRIGMNFLVGRSGVFTPALNVGYSTVEADTIGTNTTALTVEPSFGLTAGYTVMW